MQLNPQSGVFDRALALVIALMSVLGLLTVVLPASKPAPGGFSVARAPDLVLEDPRGAKSRESAPGTPAGLPVGVPMGGIDADGRGQKAAPVAVVPDGDAWVAVKSLSPSLASAPGAPLARLVSIQVRHELERIGRLAGESSAPVGFRSTKNRSLRLLRGFVRGIALGEGRQAMVSEFRREAARRKAAERSEIAEVEDSQRRRIGAWITRLESWAGREGDRDNYLNEARACYFHAIGLSDTGQHPDAYLEFALALDGFRRFIELHPGDARVPETLYLLGVSFLNLREVLPPAAMAERFLMMCTDYFSETVWGSQARQIWAPVRSPVRSGDARNAQGPRSRNAL